jgi:hypothetical protein
MNIKLISINLNAITYSFIEINSLIIIELTQNTNLKQINQSYYYLHRWGYSDIEI